jgi:hypothetical protein
MYYPKSQIKTNLYTDGNEYILSTTKEGYTGFYYEISTGQKYTGKNTQDKPNILLTPIQQANFIESRELSAIGDSPTIDAPIYFIPEDGYSKINDSNRFIPQFNPTLPTTQNQQNGQFTRYFCKKTNELQYIEISKETYTQLNSKNPQIAWDLYNPISLIWQITGNKNQVYASNRASAIAIEQNLKWYGFSQYFQDKFLKYYVES